MSISWDGFSIEAGTLDSAMDVVDAFRPRLLRMLREWNAALLAETAAGMIDHAHVRGLPIPAAPLSTAWSSIQERRLAIARTERRDPAVDPEFRLTLLRHDDCIYGLVHTERTEWRQAWLDQSCVTEFAWWNGTDRPDGIGQAEWQRRGRIWQDLIHDMWPAGHGCIAILAPRHFETDPADVLDALPCMSDRIRHTAVDLALSARMKQIAGTSDDMYAHIAAASEASFWIGTDEGVAERDRLMADMTLPDIDLAMLLGWNPEKT